MLQNSYLRKFCALKSQIVFFAVLTVLRLITFVWGKMSQNSYHHEFCAQLSQTLFLAEWPFYGLLELYEQKYHKTHISASSVNKYKKLCS